MSQLILAGLLGDGFVGEQRAHALKSEFASECHDGPIPQLGTDHSAVFHPYSRTDMNAVIEHFNRKGV